jgi:hypothetical protein
MTSKHTSVTTAAHGTPPVGAQARTTLLRAHHVRCGAHTTPATHATVVIRTLVLALGLSLAGFCPVPRARADQPAAQPAAEPAPPPVIEPGPGAALAWCAQVRTAIEAWSIDALRAGARPMHGASVVLRLNGRVMGRATQLGAPGRTIDPVSVVQAAMDEAAARAPIEAGDPERLAKLRAMGLSVQISAEIAGPVVPLQAGTLADVDAEVAMGLEGVGAGFAPGFGDADAERAGRTAAVFPSFMLASNITPSDALRQCIARLTEQPTLGLLEPAELRQKHGLRFYRFRVAHAAEPGGGVGATVLFRGQQLVDQQSIDERAELMRFVDSLLIHLARRVDGQAGEIGWVNELDHGGTVTGKASALQTAAVLIALNRPMEVQRGNMTMSRRIWPAWKLLEPGVGALARRGLEVTDTDQRLAVLLTLGEYSFSSLSAPRDTFVDGRFASWLPASARGMAAWGLKREDVIREAFALETPSSLVNQMPWLGFAELKALLPGATVVPSAPLLRQHRDLIWRHQLNAVDAGADGADLAGGIIFPGSRTPLPTWQTARAICFLARMLRDDRLTTPDERPGELVRLLAAARYLRQLQVDQALLWRAREPETSMGGIRASTFDQSLPIEATIMTVLAVTELIESADDLARGAPVRHSTVPPITVPPTPTTPTAPREPSLKPASKP